MLSKSRFLAGLQCHKRLYLECYHRELMQAPDEGRQAIFDAGAQIGLLARGLYPGGTAIDEDFLHHGAALASTRRALSSDPPPAVYEGAFHHEGINTRVDILARSSAGPWELVEVKSTAQLKGEHIPDAAVQLHVLEGAGIPVGRVCVAHLDRTYVYQGGEYDLGRLFSVEDVTAQVRGMQAHLPPLLQAMWQMLAGAESPAIAAGRQCTSPHDCPFLEHCAGDRPEHPVDELPRAGATLLRSLEEAGISDIRHIPAGFRGLTPLQERVRRCVVDGRPYLDRKLPALLQALERPIHFIDFESFNPALPMYPGTHPYQVIPFQWSHHVLHQNGRLVHRQFLCAGNTDPRPAFARSLLGSLGTRGPVLVYSGFEASRILDLAQILPDLAPRLEALRQRFVDLLDLVRRHCYHPGFHGSFSIKSVLPALAPEMGYADLAIQEGGAASAAYAEMIRDETTPERRSFLKQSLLDYCQRDTEAEVRLFQALKAEAEQG